VIVTLLVGASLAGLEGALIALPIAAAVKVVIREVWLVGRTTPVTSAPATEPVGATGQAASVPR
jgi:predicted PurR-regulated permease PerM